MNEPIETKLRAARTRLCMEKPFLGALVVHLPCVPAAWCRSVATDGRTLYFSPGYIDQLDLGQTQFVLSHVALHCALGHFARRAHRLRERWDVACDYAVNALLVDDGLRPPTDALLDARFRGLSAEEIYPFISDATAERPLDVHAADDGGRADAADGRALHAARSVQSEGTDGQSRHAADALDSDAAPVARLSREGSTDLDAAPPMQALLQSWQMRLAAAGQQAQRAGCLSSSWQRLIGGLLAPRLPWRVLLARFLTALARDDYSFQRPARREGDALMPRLHSGRMDVCIVLDTSGSIGDQQLREFVAEIDALKAQVRARVTVHACDHALSPDGPWMAEAWQALDLPRQLIGGGGTDFRPVFDWIAQQRIRPDALVYFTDGEGEFPPLAPPYPVLWLVKGRAPVPWGERIQLN